MILAVRGNVWPYMERGKRKVEPHWVREVLKENVSALMAQKEISSSQLGKLAKVGRKSVDRLRSGENSTLDTVGAIADVLGVEPAELLRERSRRPLLVGQERRTEGNVRNSLHSIMQTGARKGKK
jgi:transcriptional regulator with XRE-family HTH domain